MLSALSAAFAVFALIALPIVLGLCWWVAFSMLMDKAITAVEFVIYLGISLGVVLEAFALSGTPVFPVLALAAMAFPVALPVAGWLAEKLARERMYLEDIAHYQAAVALHPDVPYFIRKLADVFYDSRQWALAKYYYEQYYKRTSDKRVKYRIDRCQAMLAGKQVPCLKCPHCGAETPRRLPLCIYCNQPLPETSALAKVLRVRRGIRPLLWGVLGVSVVGIVLSLLNPAHLVLATGLWILAIAGVFVYTLARLGYS